MVIRYQDAKLVNEKMLNNILVFFGKIRFPYKFFFFFFDKKCGKHHPLNKTLQITIY